MARDHARILTSIWRNDDFIALDPIDQRTFLFLLSQPDLSHCGALTLAYRRWALAAPGMDSEGIRESVARLASARFVIIDEQTEELLIRTFVRHDGVLKQPQMVKAATKAAEAIHSTPLRTLALGSLTTPREPFPKGSTNPETTLSEGSGVGEGVGEGVDLAVVTPQPPASGGRRSAGTNPRAVQAQAEAENRRRAAEAQLAATRAIVEADERARAEAVPPPAEVLARVRGGRPVAEVPA